MDQNNRDEDVLEMLDYALRQILDLWKEIKSIRAAANPSVESPRAGADLTSPAPAVSSADLVVKWTKMHGPLRKDGDMAFKPWLHYSEDADELQLCATDEPSMMRTMLPSGIRWRQSNDGALAGCSIPNALAMLRGAGFERVATNDCEERMAASDEDDGA